MMWERNAGFYMSHLIYEINFKTKLSQSMRKPKLQRE